MVIRLLYKILSSFCIIYVACIVVQRIVLSPHVIHATLTGGDLAAFQALKVVVMDKNNPLRSKLIGRLVVQVYL